jgi:hypothetical protein
VPWIFSQVPWLPCFSNGGFVRSALAGAIVMLHRHDDSAYTQWTDRKGQVWEVRMALEDGGWKIVEVKNVKQLLDKLRHEQEKQFDNASPPP